MVAQTTQARPFAPAPFITIPISTFILYALKMLVNYFATPLEILLVQALNSLTARKASHFVPAFAPRIRVVEGTPPILTKMSVGVILIPATVPPAQTIVEKLRRGYCGAPMLHRPAEHTL